MVELAEQQWGVVSARQLRALGLTRRAADAWVDAGRLRCLHRGVYAVGHAALRIEGHWLAAVLACGEGAALSHHSAAALWGFRHTPTGDVHVTTLRGGRHRDGIRAHRTRGFAPEDVAAKDGIRVTSPSRTLLDLAITLSPGDLESTVARAYKQRAVDPMSIEELLLRSHGHRGRGRLARASWGEPKLTKRKLEELFLELVREAGLPEPETNAWMTFGGGEEWEIDVLWRDRRVTVELDSWQFHGDRASFEKDRERAAVMQAAGFAHLQVTWRQMTRERGRVVHTLRTLLERRGRR